MGDRSGDTVLSRISVQGQWTLDLRILLGLCGAPLLLGFELVSCVSLGFPLPLDSCLFPRRLAPLGYSATRGLILPLGQEATPLPSLRSEVQFFSRLSCFSSFFRCFSRFRVVCAARVVKPSATQVVFQRLATRVQRPQHLVHAALPYLFRAVLIVYARA